MTWFKKNGSHKERKNMQRKLGKLAKEEISRGKKTKGSNYKRIWINTEWKGENLN